jgi:PTH1 family peptidyl-tRNA hydrolase
MQWIFVGLGNPGGAYEGTRHNAGRFVMDHFASTIGASEWEYKKTYDAQVAKAIVDGVSLLMMKPETYMNDSGRSLLSLVKDPDQAARTVVLHDDIDLPLGTWRISFDRGHGGQRGVRSIIERLRTKAFIRVRIGVLPTGEDGKAIKPKGENEVVSFVLGKMRPEEKISLEKVSNDINHALHMILTEGVSRTMNEWNTR